MPHWTQGPEAILAPTSMAAFMEKHWDGEPLVLQGRDPGLVEGLDSHFRFGDSKPNQIPNS